MYSIVLKITDGDQKVVKFIDSYKHSGFSCNILAGFVNLVKNSALKSGFCRDGTEQFANILRILYAEFSLEDVKKDGNLERTIKNFIDSLKADKFYIPEELRDNSTELIDIDYNLCTLESLVSGIQKAIKSLREEKIQFWKELLEKYKNDKVAFDYEFKIIKERNAEMEKRASKLTPDDFKDLIWDPNSK